ncbi:MAG: hypothetical protein ABUL47_04425 [Leifsonia sp.]
MRLITSADGSAIALEEHGTRGSGPPRSCSGARSTTGRGCGRSPRRSPVARSRSPWTAGRPEDAVVLFQRDLVGMPPEAIEGVRHAPFWPGLVAIAPSLMYDAAVTARYADPATLAGLAAPVVVVRGRESSPFLAAASDRAVATIPGARLELVDGVGLEPDLAQVADVVARALAV